MAATAILLLVAVLIGHVHSLPVRPNIIFVLADDLSEDLVRFMPNLQRLQAAGRTFTNHLVSNSFCCPSRTTIFTGNLAHNTGVWANNGIDGGYEVYQQRGNDEDSFSKILAGRGYATGMMGKYLNGYNLTRDGKDPGWGTWAIADDGGYNEMWYSLRLNDTIVQSHGQPQDYLTDVLNGLAIKYVRDNKGRSFQLEVATYAPHAPYTPAPRDASRFPGLVAPRPPSFNRLPVGAPRWLADVPPMNASLISMIDGMYRKRAQSVQALDKLIGDLRAEVARLGLANRTFFFFSSDNGYHMGQWRLAPGKRTPYTTDIKVPLVVAGPGIKPGSATSEITLNTDLCPTFAELAGAPALDRDGVSLVPLMLGKPVAGWRSVALIESRAYSGGPNDPDWTPNGYPHNFASPPPYNAIRGKEFLYVEWTKFNERQYHNITRDPYELLNTWQYQGPGRQAALHAQVQALATCKGAACHVTTLKG